MATKSGPNLAAGSTGKGKVDAVTTNSGASRAAATTAPTVFHLMYFHLQVLHAHPAQVRIAGTANVDVVATKSGPNLAAGSTGKGKVDAVEINSGASRAAATAVPKVFHLRYFHLRYSMLTLLRHALLEQPMLM